LSRIAWRLLWTSTSHLHLLLRLHLQLLAAHVRLHSCSRLGMLVCHLLLLLLLLWNSLGPYLLDLERYGRRVERLLDIGGRAVDSMLHIGDLLSDVLRALHVLHGHEWHLLNIEVLCEVSQDEVHVLICILLLAGSSQYDCFLE